MRERQQPCGFHCIKISRLSVAIGGNSIIEDVNLHLHCGMLSTIIGKNGAGKSTLLKAILGEVPHTGDITFRDHEDGKVQHMKIGYIPQNINIDKHTPLSVYDLLASYSSKVPVFLKRGRKTYAAIKKHLDFFQAAELIDRQVGHLSGGEFQRVLLSMATMDEANLLILDEPVSGVDQNGMQLFYENIDYLKKYFDLAIILISHDLEYVARYADHVILLDHTVKKDGTAREVYESKEFKECFGNVSYEWGDSHGSVV